MSHQKRKNGGGSDEMTGREKKKVRVAEARTIPVQSVASTSSSQAAGPSKVVPMNSLKGLPSAIDIEKIIELRAFEIGAMQTAMKTASSSSTQRVWQTLPRHLRRRAASHDVRRVPKRLRERAVAEMDALPVKKKKLPQRGKGKHESRTDSLLRRQKDKAWLETHIWHSKRMIMENMWGYRLAVKPTEKAYRPSHRASVQGAIIHDASYYSLVELRGTPDTLIGTLNLCCDPQGPGPKAARFVNGTRTHETHIYEPGQYPLGLITPISIMWQPLPEPIDPKGKGKEPSPTAPIPESQRNTDRVVWLRFHPVSHEKAISALQAAASQYLSKKKADGNEGIKIQIVDLKDQINVFEIMGPQASQVIRGALGTVPGDQRDDFKKFWRSMGDIQTSGSVPRNMVVGFKLLDPRLSFPPSRARPLPGNQANSEHVFPSTSLARSEIWDEKTRLGLTKPKFTKQELDNRRANNLVPGTPLEARRRDNRVPVLLIQRSLEASKTTGGHAIHGWTLILPSGWGMAFWPSFVFTGTRVAGQRERQTQAYEAGTAYFPQDYPFTGAYEEFSKEREAEMKASWDRKPPAKRTNFQKLDVEDPFSPNWDEIMGTRSAEEQGALVSTQRGPQGGAAEVKPWLLRGPDVPKIMQALSSAASPAETLAKEMNTLRERRSLGPLVIAPRSLLRGGLVIVKVNVCKRGLPQDLALIYSLDDDEVKQALTSAKRKETSGEEEENEFIFAPGNAPVGQVTTGNYSLSIGQGYGVGAISLSKWLDLLKQQPETRQTSSECPWAPYVKIRNTNSNQLRLARLELLVEGDV